MRPWAAPDYCCLVRRSVISHVIPLRLVQILNWHRWNCNVCGLSRKMTELNYVRNLFRGSRWRVSAPQALRTVGCVPIGGRAPIGVFFRLKYRSGSPTMSHVIPLRLVQTLNLHRWNFNVCGLSRKMTELNYVRNLSGGFLGGACRRRSQALRAIGLPPRRWVLPFEIPEWFPNNVACNCPECISGFEMGSLIFCGF